MSRPVLIRVDGRVEIGLGHVYRMLALAEALEAVGLPRPVFVTRESPAADEKIQSQRYDVLRLNLDAELLEIVEYENSELLVIDLKAPETVFDMALNQRIPLVVAFVDEPLMCHGVDFVVNGQITAGLPEVEVKDGIQYLRGPRYMPLRKEFSLAPGARMNNDDIPVVLVTMGGSDPLGATPRIIRELLPLRDAKIQAVLGAAFPHLEALSFCRDDSRFEIIRNSTNMRRAMEQADVAIAPVGITLYELAATNTPTLIVGQVPEQEEIAAALAGAGFGVHMGLEENLPPGHIFEVLTELLRNKARSNLISAKGRQLVDGKGALRVAEEIAAALKKCGTSCG